jgi:peptide/nickel transport system ATP-binding protein
MSMLRVDKLHVGLDGDGGLVRAIDGLSLAIERGETFALVGESGCGKSMTALALLRLLPDNGRVEAGHEWLDGQDLFDLPEAAMRRIRGRRIGIIFQEPATSLNPVMRIGAQIVEVIEAHTPLRGAAARARAVAWLERVGIPQPALRVDDYPFQLSGGQKQRVMIAIALAAEPDLLIADEPTTALDVTLQAQVLELLRALQRERGMGLLLITHDLAVVAGMADRVALMYAGQIVEVAPAADFFSRALHPYARLLLKALPGAGQRGQSLAAIAGTVPALDRAFDACRFAPRCPDATAACQAGEPALDAVDERRAVRCVRWRALSGDPGASVPSRAAAPPGPRAAATVSMDRSGEATAPAAARSGEQDVLTLEALSVRYRGRRGALGAPAVDQVSLHLGRGETLALVGESGCGKTTIGKAVVQLLRDLAVIEGRAWLRTGEAALPGGSPRRDLFTLQGEALRTARRDVQIVFQDPFASLNPRLRVDEILAEGLLALRPELDAAARAQRVREMVERVGLAPEALARFPHEFSGGQRQRIAIARALAVEPRLIVCDEPTSALDVSVQAQILNLLRGLQRDTGVSYLFITHNIGVVAYIADRVAVMQDGRIVEAGPVGDILSHPETAMTRRLLDAVPRLPSTLSP